MIRFHPGRRSVATVLGALLIVGLLPAISSAHVRDGAYTYREKQIGADPGERVGGTVRCPKGKRVVNGGAFWRRQGEGPSAAWATYLVASVPLTDATGWYAAGFAEETSGSMILTIRVACLPKTALGPYTVIKRDLVAPLPAQVGGFAACPQGQRVTAGGTYWHRAGQGPGKGQIGYIASSGTGDLTSWYASGYSVVNNVRLRIVALCLPRSRVGDPGFTYTDLDSGGGHVGAYWSCPDGQRVLAGGAFWHPVGQGVDPSLRTILSNSAPTQDGRGIWASGFPFQGDMQLRLMLWCVKPR